MMGSVIASQRRISIKTVPMSAGLIPKIMLYTGVAISLTPFSP